jgi:hypothetical protein
LFCFSFLFLLSIKELSCRFVGGGGDDQGGDNGGSVAPTPPPQPPAPSYVDSSKVTAILTQTQSLIASAQQLLIKYKNNPTQLAKVNTLITELNTLSQQLGSNISTTDQADFATDQADIATYQADFATLQTTNNSSSSVKKHKDDLMKKIQQSISKYNRKIQMYGQNNQMQPMNNMNQGMMPYNQNSQMNNMNQGMPALNSAKKIISSLQNLLNKVKSLKDTEPEQKIIPYLNEYSNITVNASSVFTELTISSRQSQGRYTPGVLPNPALLPGVDMPPVILSSIPQLNQFAQQYSMQSRRQSFFMAILYTVSSDVLPGNRIGGYVDDEGNAWGVIAKNFVESAKDILKQANIPYVILDAASEYGRPDMGSNNYTGIRSWIQTLKILNQYNPSSDAGGIKQPLIDDNSGSPFHENVVWSHPGIILVNFNSSMGGIQPSSNVYFLWMRHFIQSNLTQGAPVPLLTVDSAMKLRLSFSSLVSQAMSQQPQYNPGMPNNNQPYPFPSGNPYPTPNQLIQPVQQQYNQGISYGSSSYPSPQQGYGTQNNPNQNQQPVVNPYSVAGGLF